MKISVVYKHVASFSCMKSVPSSWPNIVLMQNCIFPENLQLVYHPSVAKSDGFNLHGVPSSLLLEVNLSQDVQYYGSVLLHRINIVQFIFPLTIECCCKTFHFVLWSGLVNTLSVTDTASMPIALIMCFKRNISVGSKDSIENAKMSTHEDFMSDVWVSKTTRKLEGPLLNELLKIFIQKAANRAFPIQFVQYAILFDNWSYSRRPKLSLCTYLVIADRR